MQHGVQRGSKFLIGRGIMSVRTAAAFTTAMVAACSTPYRDDASKILPVTVSTASASSWRRRLLAADGDNKSGSGGRTTIRDDQIRRVAAALCPALVAEASPSDEGGSSSTEEERQMEFVQGLRRKLKVKPLEGGLSNELFVVENNGGGDGESGQQSSSNVLDFEKVSVLVRIHPSSSSESTGDNNNGNSNDNPNAGVRQILDREAENRLVAWLSSQGVGPTFYGRFRNGRVEEFYDNHVPLRCRDMARYGPQIAVLLAELHQMRNVPDDALSQNHHRGDDSNPQQQQQQQLQYRGDIWGRIQQWIDMADEDYALCPSISSSSLSSMGEAEDGEQGTGKQQEKEQAQARSDQQFSQLLSEIKVEWAWLRSALMVADDESLAASSDPGSPGAALAKKAVAFGREVVLAHMDAQSLNLLRPVDVDDSSNNALEEETRSSSLKLIDYEYAGWNPRVVDIANTFCEYCDMNNLRANFPKEYPSEEDQNSFLRAYLNDIDSSLLSGGAESEDTFLAALRDLIGKHTLVSHLGWSAWSLVQHEVSSIEYDYLAYAQHRMDGYRYFKQRYFGQ